MATMNISLPDPLRAFVEDRVSEGGYSTASEYFRELVRADQQHRAEERLEQLLLEGLNSGEPIEVTPEYVQSKLEKLTAKHGRHKQKGRP
jgi:antitoxin ParD1/3/4